MLINQLEQLDEVKRLGEISIGGDLSRNVSQGIDRANQDDRRVRACHLAIGVDELVAIGDGHAQIEENQGWPGLPGEI